MFQNCISQVKTKYLNLSVRNSGTVSQKLKILKLYGVKTPDKRFLFTPGVFI